MNGFPYNLFSYAKAAALGVKELKSLSLSRIRKVFSLMGRREKIAFLVLLIIAIVSCVASVKNFYYGHTYPAPAFGGVYSEGVLGQPGYINPLLARMEPDLSLTKLVFSGLYKYDSGGQLVADLAEGMPTVSEDQKHYTINLKRDAKWHNGRPVTADDVIFTIQLIKDPAYKSPLNPLWLATSIEKLSDYSVRFTTKDVSGPFADNLTLGILPKSLWSNIQPQNFLLAKNNLEAVGSGPYKISEIKKLPGGKIQEISLSPSPDYHGQAAKISRITFKFYDSEKDILNAFHSREINGFGFIPLGSNLYVDKNQANARVVSVALPQYQVVFFNLNNKILTDPSVRQALAAATDSRQIISEVFKDNALLPTSPLLFNSQKNRALANAGDLELAKSLLDKAGWTTDTKTGSRANKKAVGLEITLTTNDSLVNAKAAEILANQWRKLGIKVNLIIVATQQLMDTVIRPRTFDVLLFPQKFGADPDPFLFWHSSQVKNPGFNLTGFKDVNADKLIIEARATTDKKLRASGYEKFNGLVMSKFPVIFLDQTQYIYTLDSSLKNINLNVLYDPSLRFNDVSNWYIEEKRVWK